jgi:hypothetical protein
MTWIAGRRMVILFSWRWYRGQDPQRIRDSGCAWITSGSEATTRCWHWWWIVSKWHTTCRLMGLQQIITANLKTVQLWPTMNILYSFHELIFPLEGLQIQLIQALNSHTLHTWMYQCCYQYCNHKKSLIVIKWWKEEEWRLPGCVQVPLCSTAWKNTVPTVLGKEALGQYFLSCAYLLYHTEMLPKQR